MPTPIGHALGGLIVGLLTAPSNFPGAVSPASATPRLPAPGTRHRSTLVLSAVAACLPDLDFFWGRHNMETHSLGFAVLVGLGIWAWTRSANLGLTSALAVASHVLFDWLGSDDTPPLGVMALWPLSSAFYFANAFVFDAISRRYWLPNFIMHNLLAVARELAILLPIAGALWLWRRRRKLSNGTCDPTAKR